MANSKLKVWLYIQGGGFQSNADRNYSGTAVIKKSGHNIVFVNFSYRAGALGFLASEMIRKDGALNVGLLDQRFVMEWVKKNIAKLGGDPDHVVIHGASAGAGSVAYHLAAYGGRDDKLFVGAAVESPFLSTHPTVSESELLFDRFVNHTRYSSASNTMSCLRSKDIDTLQASSTPASLWGGGSFPPQLYFLPVIDNDFSRDYLSNQWDKGESVKGPILLGDDMNE